MTFSKILIPTNSLRMKKGFIIVGQHFGFPAMIYNKKKFDNQTNGYTLAVYS